MTASPPFDDSVPPLGTEALNPRVSEVWTQEDQILHMAPGESLNEPSPTSNPSSLDLRSFHHSLGRQLLGGVVFDKARGSYDMHPPLTPFAVKRLPGFHTFSRSCASR